MSKAGEKLATMIGERNTELRVDEFGGEGQSRNAASRSSLCVRAGPSGAAEYYYDQIR